MNETQGREPWEIAWHIRLQNILSYYRMEDMACKAIGIKRVEAIDLATSKANALIAKHGVPGTAALSAAADSIEALADTASNGIVLVAPIMSERAHVQAGGCE